MSLLPFPRSPLLASLTSGGYGQAPRGKAVSALPPAQQGHQYHWSGESGRCTGQRPGDVTWEGLSEVSWAGDLAEVTCPQPQLPRVCSARGLLLLAGSTREDPSSALRQWGPGRGVLPPRPQGTCTAQPYPPWASLPAPGTGPQRSGGTGAQLCSRPNERGSLSSWSFLGPVRWSCCLWSSQRTEEEAKTEPKGRSHKQQSRGLQGRVCCLWA